MLLRRDAPSWLYQVDRGATTVWERWDAILPDGSIHSGAMDALPSEEADREEGSMLSFNHYAYGAMIDWVYRTVGGLAPDADEPGYRTVHVAPRPAEGLEAASASIQTRLGRLAIDWAVDDGVFEATLEVPFGARAVLDLPVTDASDRHGRRRAGAVRTVPRHAPDLGHRARGGAAQRSRSRLTARHPQYSNISNHAQRSAMSTLTTRVVVDAPYRSDIVASAAPIIGWITETDAADWRQARAELELARGGAASRTRSRAGRRRRSRGPSRRSHRAKT